MVTEFIQPTFIPTLPYLQETNDPVMIDGKDLTIEEVVRVARYGARVHLTEDESILGRVGAARDYIQAAVDAGKPEHIAERIVEGKMEKFFEQEVLLEQPFAKDSSKSVGQYVTEAGGENATVVGFVRFKLGERSA